MAEILAPVGGTQQLTAAVRCGADAVYLGTGGFNARRNAENFTAENLSETVGYCHARGVKVYVTVNTLVMDSELDALSREAELIAKSGADAVIIQDMAVMALFRDRCPGIKRHASTQMVVHDLEGAKLMQELGFERVVLARELSLREMERVIAGVDLECEAFVHGAHCMSVSGACYISAMLGGRSGNRGLCAQPCRTDFKAGGRDYALSLRDMSYISRLRELEDVGVASFKIEGRMKRPEYVAAVVTACREALAGRPYDVETVKNVFSRSGFTQGYLDAKRDASMFGVRTKEDAEASKTVLGSIAGLYRAERQSIPVTMTLDMGETSTLTVACQGERLSLSGPAPEKPLSRPTDAATAAKSLSRTGGTPFTVEQIEVNNSAGLALPPAALNALRREALEGLLSLREAPKPHDFLPGGFTLNSYEAAQPPALRARYQSAAQIGETEGIDRLILPLSELNADLYEKYGSRLIAELPALAFLDDEARVKALARQAYELGIRDALAGNAYSLRMAKRLGFSVHGGYGLNIFNTPALQEYEALGLCDATVSFELQLSRVRRLGGTIPRGIVAYGSLPLMRFRACPARTIKGCGDCKGRPTLTDSGGVRFPVLCEGRRYSTLLNSVPLDIADRDLSGLDFITLYFTLESKAQCDRVIAAYKTGERVAEPHTTGLYFRAVQ